ncbi:MAG TPA: MarR family transcriptional regulator [Candidatus Saccharimonadales bacterium]|nr:MarR family transcriptional regulator [Candidatus Saccharimonadales bacterium]
MARTSSFEEAYMVLIKFLMLSKHRVIELGSEYDLTAMQTMTLFLLDEPRPMLRFKKVFNCDASNVTGIIDGLEHKKLVSRYENPDDRRIKMVKLEEQGETVRSALLQKLGHQDGPILSRLDPGEFRTFITLLRKVTQEA